MISVIIPNYNSSKTISGTLDSIYTTDFKDFKNKFIDFFETAYGAILMSYLFCIVIGSGALFSILTLPFRFLFKRKNRIKPDVD